MFPRYAYVGNHERETIAPEDTTYRFLLILAETGEDMREELSQLPPQSGMVAKPFSVEASKLLMMNDSNADIILD